MGGYGWLGIAVAVALTSTTAACTSHHNGATRQSTAATLPSTSPTPTGRLLELRATKSFSFKAGVREATVSDAANLVVAKDLADQSGGGLREATLVIQRPSVAATCVMRADLHLYAVAVTGGPADVGVFPSAALAFARDQSPEVPSQLLDNHPAGHATVSSRQPLSIDVTDLVRTWLRGVFPSRGATVPRSAPLLLTVQPPDLTSGRYAVTFAGVRTSQGPELTVQDQC